ncbi:MAG: hypothetical protein JO116_22035 [Planctomycetaceae bacterium]|nr:hypothetical protein [Planctomycetaceae bacterium]
MGVTRHPLRRISLVELILLSLQSEVQELFPLVIQVQRPDVEHRLGPLDRPPPPRLFQPVLDQMPACPLATPLPTG